MNKEKIAKIVSQVKSKEIANKKSKLNTPDSNKDKITRISKIMLDIEKSVSDLND